MTGILLIALLVGASIAGHHAKLGLRSAWNKAHHQAPPAWCPDCPPVKELKK